MLLNNHVIGLLAVEVLSSVLSVLYFCNFAICPNPFLPPSPKNENGEGAKFVERFRIRNSLGSGCMRNPVLNLNKEATFFS